MPIQIPSLGDTVIYVMPSGHFRAAIVVGEFNSTTVNLQVLTDPANDTSLQQGQGLSSWEMGRIAEGRWNRTSVMMDEENFQPGTWHWKERGGK